MQHAVPFLLGWLVLIVPAGAQVRRAYVTELGRRALTGTDQIVEGKVAKILPPFRGVSAARVAVATRIHGYDRAKTLTVLYVNDFVAPDAFRATLERASVRYERDRKRGLRGANAGQPDGTTGRERSNKTQAEAADLRRGHGVRLAEGESGLFFLKRRGASYSLFALLPKRDPFYTAKRRRLVATLDLERGGSIVARAKRAKTYFLAALRSSDVWERGHAAREVRALSERYRDVFTRAEGERLVKMLYKENEPPILASLERAVRAIDPNLAGDWAQRVEREQTKAAAPSLKVARARLQRTAIAEARAADLAAVAQRWRRGATPLLIEYLKDPAPIVRERAAQAIAEIGGPSANKPLREALREERDENAVVAMIYACGVKGDTDAVPLLEERLNEPRYQSPALTALARVGSEPARKALLMFRRTADEPTQKLIDRMIEEEFPDRS